ncbi:hypothetical protein BSR29_06020 [Boudabousia liubingyangii]|uniref:CT398-like coiled coil hairpin domain-containing protein n=1 Tax=Boudabousia liubingyangii TaxID=1921764 RepID=A0A1Q5PKL7_9ACTO|nr:hypothetical protein [Boudabousia liubingyangii]OKL46501.1 hypothetical protein BSR28_08260 [Boudabousia liubingyangii]OKL47178.1 hypothetical protein BSR29_06020 [Boudabousia liubingyangii]
MKATPKQQLALLEMQDCDTRLARLSYDSQHLPQNEQIMELRGKQDELTRTLAQSQAARNDAQRALKKLDSDIEKTTARLKVQQERQEAGLGDLRELNTRAEEIATLEKRISDLEEEHFDLESEVEQLEAGIAQTETSLSELSSQVSDLHEQRDNELADLKSQAQPLIDRRKAAMQVAGEELTREYDEIRKSTGGIGAVALHGRQVEGMTIQFSATEWERIRTAPVDELVCSDDFEWILVRIHDQDGNEVIA